MTSTMPQPLPMAGRTHANRSPITCHLRCGDACAQPLSNTSEGTTFRSLATAALSRRKLLGAAGAGMLMTVTSTATADPKTALGNGADAGISVLGASTTPAAPSGLTFAPIAPVAADVDAVTVPAGYSWHPILRWGDPLFPNAPAFDVNAQTPEAQAQQCGYNNDFTTLLRTGHNRYLLVCSHEYTNENLMFPPSTDPAVLANNRRVAIQAHGFSVIEVRLSASTGRFKTTRHSTYNRRITGTTIFHVDGPAAGHPLLRTERDPLGTQIEGTLGNCSGGVTPWGTVLSGEENFHNYFTATGTSATEKRYGLSPKGDDRQWRSVDPRFDATKPGFTNEPNRFGWIVEVDPLRPDAAPVKHTAMGRLKHEGANVRVAPDGRVVAYMGDDEKFEYLYKFVSRNRLDHGSSPQARLNNQSLLSEGDLYVARFTGDGMDDGLCDGVGEWIPLTLNGESQVPGMSIAEVLVFTRMAADKVQPTKMDRPEDVEPHPVSGTVYVVCTNNSDRGKPGKEGATEVAPRVINKDGHIIELMEHGNDPTATTFAWLLFLICGGPNTAGTYFGGWTGPVSPISCPDNVAFDAAGNLWVATDGAPNSLALADGLFKVPVTGPERGRVQQFLALPHGAETCGPVLMDAEQAVIVAVQHPGEDGTWEKPQSYFPDYVGPVGTAPKGDWRGPRPAVIAVRPVRESGAGSS